MTREPIAVRRMAQADVAEVSRLQAAHLKGSVLSGLGLLFLRRFHTAALEHSSTRAFVAIDASGVIGGFVVASLDIHRFSQHVKPRVFTAVARSLLSRRGLAEGWRILRTVVERGPKPDMPAELLLLVVDPRARRLGIGRSLIGAIEPEFQRHGVGTYRVAVRSDLADARGFYQALGFEFDQMLPVLGKPMTYLTKSLI